MLFSQNSWETIMSLDSDEAAADCRLTDVASVWPRHTLTIRSLKFNIKMNLAWIFETLQHLFKKKLSTVSLQKFSNV